MLTPLQFGVPGGVELLILVAVVVIGLLLFRTASSRSGLAKLSIVVGIALLVLDSFLSAIANALPRNQTLLDVLNAIQPITGLWWLFLLAGIGLVVYPRITGAGALSPRGGQGRAGISLERQDIIASTDWTRLGRFVLRRSIGIALAVSTIVLLILSLALQKFALAALWVVLLVGGVIIVAATWRRAHPTVSDFTHTTTVRAPDQFAVHSVHVELRQQAEDLGYQIVSNVSPAEGGTPSAANQDVFHADGGFEGRHRLIGESRPLLSEIENEYVNQVFTLMTLGIFFVLFGVLLMAIDPGEVTLVILGIVFFIAGAAIAAYDYVMRTREWAELYCIEEGTIYTTTINKYEDDVLDSFDSRVDPTVSTSETAGILSVTVGARCSSLYDEDDVEEDFDALVGRIEKATEDYRFEVLDHDETASGARGT